MPCFPKEKGQENGTDSKTLRPWQKTTDSSAVLFLVRKGPLGNFCLDQFSVIQVRCFPLEPFFEIDPGILCGGIGS